jgi:hypothetical protein
MILMMPSSDYDGAQQKEHRRAASLSKPLVGVPRRAFIPKPTGS